jgi:hypothetical protein
MNKHFLVTALCSTVGLISASGFALAETVGRYECSIVGSVSQDPVGDRDGHLLRTVQYSCLGVEGLVKDAVTTGASISEWDGSQGKYLSGGAIVRAPAGLAVSQITEGTGTVVMKDGKPIGADSSGKVEFKLGLGTLAALSGKLVRFESKPTGFGRFSIDLTTDGAAATVGTSKQ